ncbi:hypothetical protein AB0454_35655 [Streptomyces sp. NPDC093509]|uniref:hypothetical protein n=1 Tax=Streptomyces sp. NPDC093509 TaxID=3154982 RepID=UPI0034505623
MAATALLCGGHLEIGFASAPDGALVPASSRWDGEHVPPVVAEALAETWAAAGSPDDEPTEDDTSDPDAEEYELPDDDSEDDQ